MEKTNIEIKYTQTLTGEIQKQWDFLIREHPLPHFFQSPAYFKIWVGESGSSPFLFYAIDDDKVVGILSGVFISSENNIKREFTKRIIFTGGPLIHPNNDQNNIGKKLIEAYIQKFPFKPIYSEFRMPEMTEIFEDISFNKDKWLNIFVDTQKDPDEIFKKISESKRRQIKTSLKKGAEIVKATTEKDVKEYYNLLSSFYKYEVKKPLPSIKLFLKFLTSTKEENFGEILLIKYEGKVVGGIVCPAINNGYVHEWYICGLDKEYKSKGIFPSVLATWAGINYAIESGAKYFDFMGAGKSYENYGVRDFKEKFGGETIITSRFIYIHKPILYKLGKLAIKLGLGG